MLFSTVLIWLLVAVGFVVALPALWVLTLGLWPGRAERLTRVAEAGLGRSVLIGLLPTVGAVLLISVLARLPQMGLLAALVAGVVMLWGLAGLSGTALLLGRRLWPAAEPWRQVKHGGLTLIGCALLPVVGWFVLLPLMAVAGAGMQVRAWLGRKREAPAPAPVPPPPLPTEAP
jgi:hypothetical protein